MTRLKATYIVLPLAFAGAMIFAACAASIQNDAEDAATVEESGTSPSETGQDLEDASERFNAALFDGNVLKSGVYNITMTDTVSGEEGTYVETSLEAEILNESGNVIVAAKGKISDGANEAGLEAYYSGGIFYDNTAGTKRYYECGGQEAMLAIGAGMGRLYAAGVESYTLEQSGDIEHYTFVLKAADDISSGTITAEIGTDGSLLSCTYTVGTSGTDSDDASVITQTVERLRDLDGDIALPDFSEYSSAA